MCCCKGRANSHGYLPWYDDCHTSAEDCLKGSGLGYKPQPRIRRESIPDITRPIRDLRDFAIGGFNF